MSKYQPLYDYLTSLSATQSDVTLRFDEIEQILGDRLPASATRHQAWWGNEVKTKSHTQAQAWLAAGWRVDAVDQAQRWVRFRRG